MSYTISPAQTVGEAAGTVTFTVSRADASVAETLLFSTSPVLGASNNGDYAGILDLPLGFAVGESSKTVTVRIIDDAQAEATESFRVILQRSQADPYDVFLASSQFTIIDDDQPKVFKPFALPAYPVAGIIGIAQGNRDNDDSHAPGTARQWAYDFLAPLGSEVRAVASGVVVAVRQDITGAVRGYGNLVTIRTDDGFYVTYAHLLANAVTVAVGARVTQGDVIALSGDSGTFDGTALHPHTHIQFGTAVSSLNAVFSDPATATLIADGAADQAAPAFFPKLVIDFANRADPGLSTDTDYYGTAGIDDFRGNGWANRVMGLGGNDVMQGNGGRDTLDGGAGRDTAVYSEKTSGISVTLNGASSVIVFVNGIDEDTILNIENVTGGSGADQIAGDSLNNVFYGGLGNDTLSGAGGNDNLFGEAGSDALSGGAGNDFLHGGTGQDRLTGGAGYDALTGGTDADTFIYTAAAEFGDTINDFRSKLDMLQFAAGAFGFAAAGVLAADAFESQAGHNAASATVRFIFDTSDTTLWYDADGSGSGAAVLVADLQAGAALLSSDIRIV